MDDLRLKVFVAVVESKSFSKAAKKLFITQPGVSLHVHKLEEYFSTRLFERQEKVIALTRSGEILYNYAKRILAIKSEMEEEMFHLTGHIGGKITIGASTTIGEYVLPKILGEFKRKYPEVEILLRIGNTEMIIKEMLEYNLDLGLIEGPCQNSKIVIKKFLDDELVCIVPNTDFWRHKKFISLEDLYSAGLIVREPGSGTREIIEEYLKMAGRPLDDLSIVMELGSSEAIKAAVEAALGVSIVSKWTLLKEKRLKSLKVLKLKNLSMDRDFNFIYLKEGFQSKMVNKFIQVCLDGVIAND